jgi:hypothetical protein
VIRCQGFWDWGGIWDHILVPNPIMEQARSIFHPEIRELAHQQEIDQVKT